MATNTHTQDYARTVTFANGYGASIVCRANIIPADAGVLGDVVAGLFGGGTYGAEYGLFEVAVLDRDGELTYDTEITDDVIGNLDFADVAAVLARISLL